MVRPGVPRSGLVSTAWCVKELVGNGKEILNTSGTLLWESNKMIRLSVEVHLLTIDLEDVAKACSCRTLTLGPGDINDILLHVLMGTCCFTHYGQCKYILA